MKGRIITRTFRLIFILGVVIINASGSVGNAAYPAELTLSCPSSFNVMPLGDSITTGKYSGSDTLGDTPDDDIGYRLDLWDLLDSAGCTVNFVGTQSNGSTYPFSDPDHEGHNGKTDDFIAENIYNNGGENWLDELVVLGQDPPDVILLHIGTNTPRVPANVELILDEIDEYESDKDRCVVVFLARIIDKSPFGQQPINQYNNDVQIMAEERPDFGSELFMVNMYNGAGIDYSSYKDAPPGDMLEDGIHPYYTGYSKMAGKWKEKFDEVYVDGGVNNPPTVVEPFDQEDTEGQSVSLQINADDLDGDSLTYSATNLPPGLSIDSTSGLIAGTLTYAASNYSPYQVVVRVSDEKTCGIKFVSFLWTIEDLNFPPEILNPPGDQNNAEGDNISLDVDASDPDDDPLTYSTTGLPDNLSIDPDTGLISGDVSYTASPSSPYSVTVTVTDTDSNATNVEFLWNVNYVNAPPEVQDPGDQESEEGWVISLQINAEDPNEDPLTYSNIAPDLLPPGLSINENTGQISGIISHFAVMGMSSKDFLVEITVTDIADSPIDETVYFTWKVNNVNGPPVMVNPGNQFNQVDEIISLQIKTTDPDGDAYQFTENDLPPSLVIGKTTGLISGKLAKIDVQSSPHTVTITATDDDKSSQINFIWVVTTGEIYLPFIFR